MEGPITINYPRLKSKIEALAEIGKTPDGGVCRLALTDEDKEARELVILWMQEAGLTIQIDEIGNIFGTRPGKDNNLSPIMTGSHIDSVRSGGKLDGPYGVLAGIEACDTLNSLQIKTTRPITVAIFTNEEGARFTPDMMGSLVHVGGLDIETALNSKDKKGISIRDELERTGFNGPLKIGTLQPHTFVELHIEQGPVLEKDGGDIGAVYNLQGISWQEITIEGTANHAGTTPLDYRKDAGLAAARIITFIGDMVLDMGGGQIGTVGEIKFEPNIINVIPGKVSFSVDLRNTDNTKLSEAESRLVNFLKDEPNLNSFNISSEKLVRFDSVTFNPTIAKTIENQASILGYKVQKMTSGAGHDAQMMSRICPSAMIFVPSIDGISHNPREATSDDHLEKGANVLLNTILKLSQD